MTMPDRPLLSPADVKWRVDSDPVPDGTRWKARYVAWLPQETLADMLDEWVGPERWWADYQPDGRSVWCQITVVTEGGVAVTKTDVGAVVGDDMKAATSDAFKRCATRMWGIGREVRQVPTLWAPCRTYTSNGKTVGAPNNETRPTLDRKLRDLGFAGWSPDPEHGPDDTHPDHTSEGAQPSNPPTRDHDVDDDVEELQRLKAQLQTLVTRREVDPASWATWKLKHKGWARHPDTLRDAIVWATGVLATAGVEPFDLGAAPGVDVAGPDGGEPSGPDPLPNPGENDTESDPGQSGDAEGVVREKELAPAAQVSDPVAAGSETNLTADARRKATP